MLVRVELFNNSLACATNLFIMLINDGVSTAQKAHCYKIWSGSFSMLLTTRTIRTTTRRGLVFAPRAPKPRLHGPGPMAVSSARRHSPTTWSLTSTKWQREKTRSVSLLGSNTSRFFVFLVERIIFYKNFDRKNFKFKNHYKSMFLKINFSLWRKNSGLLGCRILRRWAPPHVHWQSPW